MSLRADMRDVVRSAETRGWNVERTKRGHLRFVSARTGDVVIAAYSPSDHRAIANTKASLKRCERSEKPASSRYR